MNDDQRRRPPRGRSDGKPPAADALATIGRPELLVDGSDAAFRRLVHNLFALLSRHEAVRDGHAARIGLAGVEYTVLIAVAHLNAEGRDTAVRNVAEHLYLSSAFVTNITNKLASKGLMVKEPDAQDRRRVTLAVTEAGRELLRELAPAQRMVNNEQWALDADEFAFLLDMMERLIESSSRALLLQSYLRDGKEEPMRDHTRDMQ